MNDAGPAIFALDADRSFAQAAAEVAGVPIAPHEERVFEDGEQKLRPLDSVRGADAYVVSSLHAEAARSIDDKLMRLLLFIATLRDAGARRVTAVTPYLAYGRKDQRTKPRDPVTTRYLATLLEAMGLDAIVALDVHNLAAYQNAFRCRAEHLEARPTFVAHLAGVLGDRAAVVVSPDAGGIKRAEAFRHSLSQALGRDVGSGFVEKHRSEGRVFGDGFAGDIDGRVAVIVDDMISAGTTMARAAEACRHGGASAVYAVATHAVLAAEAGPTLRDAPIDQVCVTDTITARPAVQSLLGPRLVRIPVASLVGEAIRRLHDDASLVELGGS
jgi:ribose-phosphate pyrophosphokinase